LNSSKTISRFLGGITDIVEFVDALSSNPKYSRDEFDDYVDECLRKLKTSSAHLSIAKIPWRLIITTNYDLLIEQAFAHTAGTHEEVGVLKEVHNSGQYHSIQARNEIKYVKLHGCISNKREYKLIFSTDDFKLANKFYKVVLDDLRNLSDNVAFLSAGYSYSDEFAKKLLDRIDAYNFRDKRVIYNIDPYINDAILPSYSAKRICVIKATVEEFFQKFESWKEEKEVIAKIPGNNNFRNHNNDDLFIPTAIRKRVGENLRQLNGYYTSRIIAENEFYQGGEPNYNIILKGYDVTKTKKIEDVRDSILNSVNNGSSNSRLIPIFFLTGSFGTGKSTFAYRLLNKFNQQDTPTISFELFDPTELKAVDLKEIFSRSNASYIFMYVNTIEINSVFKSLLELRNRLSIELSPETKVIIIASIRENMLVKYKEGREIKNSFEINVDCPFTREEIGELVTKLRDSRAISYRDAKEKMLVENRVLKEFAGDSFISLLELVQGNKLIEDLLQAYHQLNQKCKKAFIYTSLLYQYKILMPSGLLQNIISSDWEEFRSDVIEKDGKGILIQEISDSRGTDPDLYFRTKHPLISQRLISNLLQNEEVRYNHIKTIVTHIIQGSKNTRLLIDFLKSIVAYKHLPYNKIDSLYDLADEHLGEDPVFLLHYAINLQYRQNEESILKAISKIQYAESISDRTNRNHYLIHRRGVLTFELAKLLYKKKDSSILYKVFRYVDEARDFLEIKKALDPFSSFSYTDLLNLEIWCLDKLEEDSNEKLRRRIYIEEVFDIGIRTVFENANRLYEIKNRFIESFKFNNDEKAYLEYLQNYYEDPVSRPYALILMFNHFLQKEDYEKCNDYLFELENLTLNNDVLDLLFKYYGRNLFNYNTRIKFFDLMRANPELEDYENLRFNYFNFIAECYSHNFRHAYKFLANIREKFNHINPDFHQIWIDPNNGSPALFEAVLKVNKTGKKQFYIPELNLWVKSENWDKKWQISMQFDVEVHFYIYGLKARAVNIITDEIEEEAELDNEDIEL
jgi:hypothetical protein